MRKHIVLSVFKKEVMDILRDKKTLFMTVILPVLIYPILIFLMTYMMSKSSTAMAQRTLKIAFDNPPSQALMEKLKENKKDENKLEVVNLSDKDYKKALDEGKIDAYLKVKETGDRTDYEIYYNSSKENGTQVCTRLQDILNTYKKELMNKRVQAAGLNTEEVLEPITYEFTNTAENEQMAGYLLGIILPFILVMSILMGCIYPAIDVMAGEKERGTLETLLTLPISNMELVMGKYMAVTLSALITAILSIISMGFSVVFLFLSASEAQTAIKMQIDFSKLMLPLILTFICICLFTMVVSAMSMCICSMARSFKEAQNAMTPLTVIAMILSYSSMIPTLELNTVTAGIPVVNVVLLIKQVLGFKYDISLLMMVLLSNIVFVILAIWLLSKLFKSEEILFGSSKNFAFLEKRSDIKPGTLPGMSDGILLFAVAMVMMIYVCSYLQAKFGIWGLAFTELVIIGIPVILSIYIKTDFKKVYSLNKPSVTGLLGSTFLWMGTWIVMTLIENVLISITGTDASTANELQNQMLKGHNVYLVFFIIAVMPAICEETLFRGFIYTAIKEETHYKRAILLSGVLFGLAHMDMLKILPITLMGIAMAYVLYKTGSIFCTMLFHLLNNGFAVVLTIYGESRLAEIEEKLNASGAKGIACILLIAIVLILIGAFLLNKVKIHKNINKR